MKRDIYCPRCATEMREKYGIPKGSDEKIIPYPQEGLRVMDGLALENFHCDACFAVINRRDPCAAVSFWRDDWPYGEWESGFIKPCPWPASSDHS